MKKQNKTKAVKQGEKKLNLIWQYSYFIGSILFRFTYTYFLEKEMATHSSILAWRIPGMEEPGGLLSMGSHTVGHDWSDLAAATAYIFFLFILSCNFLLSLSNSFPLPEDLPCTFPSLQVGVGDKFFQNTQCSSIWIQLKNFKNNREERDLLKGTIIMSLTKSRLWEIL